VLACAVPAVQAQDSAPRETGRQSVREQRRRLTIRHGLEYLARNQNRDGSFGQSDKGVVGITALCLLAYMAQGHLEGRGEFAHWSNRDREPRDVVARGVTFLMNRSLPVIRSKQPYISRYGKPVGYIYLRSDRDSRMHGHGYATQVLALAYGSGRIRVERAERLKLLVQRAVRVIENSQTTTGGWGYEPNHATSHEGSITVTVVQALRLARDAGFVVDRETHTRGLAYLRESQKPDGSFKYSLMSDTSTPALTAAALTAMHGFGEYYSRSVRSGLAYLLERYRDSRGAVRWPFYARYYAAQAFYRAGGTHWDFWDREVVPSLIAEQQPEGYWDDSFSGETRRGSHGRAYATAFSVLALSVPDGYLPIFQR
jgi:hypothetical protein